ncbi:MAG: hypothetical protein EOM20_18645 [Spartobacteria bacterium]|nr:hypothetical protein [Spartobacteria bacterium]
MQVARFRFHGSLYRLLPAAHNEPHTEPRAQNSAKSDKNPQKMAISTVFSSKMAFFWQILGFFAENMLFFGIFGPKHPRLAVRGRLKPLYNERAG